MGFVNFIKNIIFSIGMVYFSILFAFAPVAIIIMIALSYYFYKKNNSDYIILNKKELEEILYKIKKGNDGKKS